MAATKPAPMPIPQTSARIYQTIDGVTFDANADIWKIPTAGSSTSFNFTNLTGASPSLRDGIKSALAAILLSSAPERAMRALSGVRVLLRHVAAANGGNPIDEIGPVHVENFRASLVKRQQYQIRALKHHLLMWAGTGAQGLADDLRTALPKLGAEHHVVGRAVRTMDPETGPLTDVEYEAVVTAMRQGFASRAFDLADYALMVLALALGARPLQLAALKVKDFSHTRRHDGSPVFILQVTRLKQGKGIRARTLFRQRSLTAGVGALIQRQCEAARQWAATNGVEPDEAPIFPCISNRAPSDFREIEMRGHFAGKGMAAKVARLFTQLEVRSPRTGEKTRIFQTRLRRTLGTRAAAEGLSAAVIADLLDHSWIDSSLVYIETRGSMIERIDKALALKLAPLAQAFSGTLVSRQKTSPSSSGPQRVILIDTEDTIEAVGGCGKFQFCGLAAPLACYTCTYFRPWIDAPHDHLLAQLLAERESMREVADARIASVTDRTILAVADVINQCRAAQGGQAA